MIRNLNQVSFQGFGNVPPERSQSAKLFEKSEAISLTLSQENTIIYCAKADTWVTFDSGISVLSVSHDSEDYQHFYLDKPVCIKAGVLFAISPFMGEATAILYAKEAPEQTGMRALTASGWSASSAWRAFILSGIRRRSRASCSPEKPIPWQS